MDDHQVQEQLEHMVKFIFREAEDKAKEIHSRTNTEMTIEKDRLLREGMDKIDNDFTRRMKQIEVKKKIDYSNELNNCRLEVLKAKEEGVQKLLLEAYNQLDKLTENSQEYSNLLQDLITQALFKIREANVDVVCRKEDKNLVDKVYQAAAETYQKKTGQQVKITVRDDTFLPPSKKNAQGPEVCSGGIILSTPDGKIICSNTLDGRLAQAFEGNLPKIRETLFGVSKTRVHYD